MIRAGKYTLEVGLKIRVQYKSKPVQLSTESVIEDKYDRSREINKYLRWQIFLHKNAFELRQIKCNR